MFLLKKVFKFRDDTNPDMEKPFLEHLEDLRIMITRILITLVVAMIGCFALQKQVMDVLRRPVEDVWKVQAAATLPEDLQVEDWERAKQLEQALVPLTADEREAMLASLGDDERRLVTAVRLLRAARQLEGEAREQFLAMTAGDAEDDTEAGELRGFLDHLLETGAEPDVALRGNLKMMSALKPTETFMLSMKLAFFSGIVVSFPLLLYHILIFILPGLHNSEKKLLWPAMAIGFGLFLAGVLFAYFVVLPRALVFFSTWDQGLGVESDWRIGWYIGFATQFTLLFGLSFELPVVVMALVKLGILDYETMRRTRSYAVLAIVVIAASITPTSDLITLSLMAIPMYLLYETCIWLAYLDSRKREREEAGGEFLEDRDRADSPDREDADDDADEDGDESRIGEDDGEPIEDDDPEDDPEDHLEDDPGRDDETRS